jgi:hypothetical protein
MVFLRIPPQGNVFGKEKVMKKVFFVALATLVAMSQFGCSWWGGGWGSWLQITDYGMQIAQTLKDFNVI